ncbi:hypothetical protein COO60DRAFT_1106925 [Scenedesmus sp. NREL 46B-D3]|nr:hypothetical protein COO60DRAFT_1106925 [Scenedesmus sp. NREL 46B-D3]
MQPSFSAWLLPQHHHSASQFTAQRVTNSRQEPYCAYACSAYAAQMASSTTTNRCISLSFPTISQHYYSTWCRCLTTTGKNKLHVRTTPLHCASHSTVHFSWWQPCDSMSRRHFFNFCFNPFLPETSTSHVDSTTSHPFTLSIEPNPPKIYRPVTGLTVLTSVLSGCRPHACSTFTPVISSVATMPAKPSMASLRASSKCIHMHNFL